MMFKYSVVIKKMIRLVVSLNHFMYTFNFFHTSLFHVYSFNNFAHVTE